MPTFQLSPFFSQGSLLRCCVRCTFVCQMFAVNLWVADRLGAEDAALVHVFLLSPVDRRGFAERETKIYCKQLMHDNVSHASFCTFENMCITIKLDRVTGAVLSCSVPLRSTSHNHVHVQVAHSVFYSESCLHVVPSLPSTTYRQITRLYTTHSVALCCSATSNCVTPVLFSIVATLQSSQNLWKLLMLSTQSATTHPDRKDIHVLYMHKFCNCGQL